jgi:hypothetical protein
MHVIQLRRITVVGGIVLLLYVALLGSPQPYNNELLNEAYDPANLHQYTLNVASNSIVASATPPLAVLAKRIPNAASLCHGAAPPIPAHVHFQQVASYVGPVNISDIAFQLEKLVAADPTIPNTNGTLRVVFFALDGTLLNLLRWGQIVNDNDIDLGFYITRSNAANSTAVDVNQLNASRPLEHYQFLQEWLFHAGLMGRAIDERDVRKLHNSRKVLKPHTCKHRGQMMQCRMDASQVILDWFGPETLEAGPLTDLTAHRDVFPLIMCRAFSGRFPCPSQPIRVLKQFTLNVGSSVSGPVAHREFSGCALFPRKRAEQTKSHIESILDHGRWLQHCHHPNLLGEVTPSSPWFEAKCASAMTEAGL